MVFSCTLLCSLVFLAWSSAAQPPIVEAEIEALDLAAGWVEVAVPSGVALSGETELALMAETRPIGRYQLNRREAQRATFSRKQPPIGMVAGRLRAWLVCPGPTAARVQEKLPTDADLAATVERVGPGARTAWIDSGADEGIQPGMCWWTRLEGQPVARFDVLSVEREACFCSVVRLAAHAGIARDDRVALWPSPARRRNGTAATAISYIEHSADRTIVWVAAPRGVECPAEPHLDFFHAGQYVAQAVVESMDDLFWYARLVDSGSADESLREGAALLAVGDQAVIRTQADIAARRFVARVFELATDGAVISAGEADGIGVGEVVNLFRAGLEIGQFRIARIHGSYSVIQPLDQPAAVSGGESDVSQYLVGEKPAWKPAIMPAVGDVVRFGGVPEQPTAAAVPDQPMSLAEIDAVVDQTLFSARAVAQAKIPALRPLIVSADGQRVGVAFVLASDGERLCGVVVRPSQAGPLRPGALVQQPAAEQPAALR